MKARIPPQSAISKATKQAVDAYIDQESVGLTRRLFKLFSVELNAYFGFGATRLLRLNDAIQADLIRAKDDEAFWMHIDQRVRQLGLDFPNENYEVYDK